ncbi:hypothetical protein [Bradyrhizobium sp.]|uniref:hypothetical protein n=1 Tax=Bradyrhizobium sp. TaxID=376 RepID=UPI003C724411
MKQNIIWLALALLFAISVTLSMTAGAFRPAATAEATEPAAALEATQSVVTATATPAQQQVPVAPLDDVPPLKPAIGTEQLARGIPEPSALPAPRVVEAAVVPSPLAPAMSATVTSQPWQDSTARIKPVEGDAQPIRKSKDSKAEPLGKHLKRTANARACTSAAPSRFADLLRRLNLAPRCATRRSAA